MTLFSWLLGYRLSTLVKYRYTICSRCIVTYATVLTGIGGVSAKDLWRKKKLNFRHLEEISTN